MVKDHKCVMISKLKKFSTPLRTETNKARLEEKNVEGNLERARGAVQPGVNEQFWTSVMKFLSLRGQKQTTTVKRPITRK